MRTSSISAISHFTFATLKISFEKALVLSERCRMSFNKFLEIFRPKTIWYIVGQEKYFKILLYSEPDKSLQQCNDQHGAFTFINLEKDMHLRHWGSMQSNNNQAESLSSKNVAQGLQHQLSGSIQISVISFRTQTEQWNFCNSWFCILKYFYSGAWCKSK